MPAKITNIKDENGIILYPVTRTSAVLNANGDNLDIILAGKQDSLSSSQMEAVNSGVNAAKVTQIDTNTTNIANKLDKTNIANQLYGTDGDGNQATFLQGSNVTGNAFVKRKSSGQIKVRTNPSENDEAVGKGYVDGAIEWFLGRNSDMGDCNTYTNVGVYGISPSTLNHPGSGYGLLLAFSPRHEPKWVVQLYFSHDNKSQIKMRHYINGTWYSWATIS